MKISHFLLVAGISLALAPILSCSDKMDSSEYMCGRVSYDPSVYRCEKCEYLALKSNNVISALPSSNGGNLALDVIIRDFKSNMNGTGTYGFEEYDQSKPNRKCAEKSATNPNTPMNTSRNGICFSGGVYHSCEKGGSPVKYGGGGSTTDGYPRKGYTTGPDAQHENIGLQGQKEDWSQEVFVTRDMVRKTLDYSQCNDKNKVEGETDAIRGRYCARPMPLDKDADLCYGRDLELWFTDGGQARRIEDVLEFQLASDNVYRVYYGANTMQNWGCGYVTPGFFPLDKYNCSSTASAETWGREDCMQWPPTQTCNDDRKHNYGYSMAGSSEFIYKVGAGDMFKFVGDDDMWIFIDGELFEDPETGAHADLGGVHLAAPAVIDIDRLAARLGWKEGSPHVINFFYAERGVDDSNLYLEMSLSGLKSPRFGAPYIMEAATIANTYGASTTTIYVNNKLDRTQFNSLIDMGKFPIVMHKTGQNDLWGFKFSEHIGDPADAGSRGYAYTIVGTLCRTPTDCSYSLNSGDSLSFNIVGWEEIADGRFIDHGFVLSPNVDDIDLLIRSEAGNKANKLAWGSNAARMPPIELGDYCLIKLW